MGLKREVQTWLRRHDLHVTRHRWMPEAHRQAMLAHYRVDLLIDIGANVGQYASSLRREGFRGRVVSLEPLSEPYKQLEAAAARDPRWDTRRAAVGAETGTLDLHVSERSIFSSALPVLESTTSTAHGAVQVRTESVPMVTLDEVVAAEECDVLAVKMDVQGFEGAVLEGGRTALTRARIVEMELSPRPVYEGQMLMVEALQRLDEAGFVLSLTENLLRDAATGRCLQFNGVFVRP